MNPTPAGLIQDYRKKGILVDSNLFLLFIVGSMDPNRIARFTRTSTFDIEAFDLLSALLASFEKRYVTPNILTEVSNLAGLIDEYLKEKLFGILAETFLLVEEHYVKSEDVIHTAEFLRFGITDAAIISLVQKKFLLLTAEFPLANYCSHIGGPVINFNHIRGRLFAEVIS